MHRRVTSYQYTYRMTVSGLGQTTDAYSSQKSWTFHAQYNHHVPAAKTHTHTHIWLLLGYDYNPYTYDTHYHTVTYNDITS